MKNRKQMFFSTEFAVKDLGKYLTKSEILDLFHFLYIAHTSRDCITEDLLKELVPELKKIVPFDSFCYIYATTGREILYGLDIGYPEEYLARYFDRKYEFIDPVLQTFLEKRKVVNWKDVDRVYENKPEGVVNQEAKEFGLNDGFVYGGCDEKNLGTFWFAGRHVDRSRRSEAVIEFAARSLAAPLIELYEKNKPRKKTRMSNKELEVLNWLKEGKTSWEISTILRISERTVNFHVRNIMAKLDAVNRIHAVAIALSQDLIQK